MDKNNTTNTDISGGEKTTLHNAGVDLSSTTNDTTDGFVDIDATVADDKTQAEDIGLTFVSPQENKEDLSALAEQKLKEAQTQTTQKSTPASQPQVSDAGSIKAEEEQATDLEQEFKKTVGESAKVETPEQSLGDKVFSLQGMLTKIKEKLGIKKTEVKQELESLKKMKEDIAKDIENIKDLEDSEHKIENQLEKVETLKKEMVGIEEEVKDELQ